MKIKRIASIAVILVLVFMMSACASSKSSNTSETTISETTLDEALPVFTSETLAEYNGKDGKAAYVAYEGKVYDVSDIDAWKDGIHQGRFEAGKDYTDVLNNDAPHKPTNLTENAPVVGLFE